MKQDIDKIKDAIEDGLIVVEDVQADLESDGKITWLEGGALFVKHGGKAIRLIGAISEIKDEVVDLDGEETSEIAAMLVDHFGGSTEAKEAIDDIATGAGLLNQGIQKLIALKKN